MPEWEADVAVDENLVRRLIGEQFPDLSLESLHAIAEGWEGDLCLGEPAIDLSLLWNLFPPEGRAAFLDVYGPLAEDQFVRTRLLAVNLCVILAIFGHEEGMAGVKREALEGLERVLA